MCRIQPVRGSTTPGVARPPRIWTSTRRYSILLELVTFKWQNLTYNYLYLQCIGHQSKRQGFIRLISSLYSILGS